MEGRELIVDVAPLLTDLNIIFFLVSELVHSKDWTLASKVWEVGEKSKSSLFFASSLICHLFSREASFVQGLGSANQGINQLVLLVSIYLIEIDSVNRTDRNNNTKLRRGPTMEWRITQTTRLQYPGFQMWTWNQHRDIINTALPLDLKTVTYFKRKWPQLNMCCLIG